MGESTQLVAVDSMVGQLDDLLAHPWKPLAKCSKSAGLLWAVAVWGWGRMALNWIANGSSPHSEIFKSSGKKHVPQAPLRLRGGAHSIPYESTHISWGWGCGKNRAHWLIAWSLLLICNLGHLILLSMETTFRGWIGSISAVFPWHHDPILGSDKVIWAIWEGLWIHRRHRPISEFPISSCWRYFMILPHLSIFIPKCWTFFFHQHCHFLGLNPPLLDNNERWCSISNSQRWWNVVNQCESQSSGTLHHFNSPFAWIIFFPVYQHVSMLLPPWPALAPEQNVRIIGRRGVMWSQQETVPKWEVCGYYRWIPQRVSMTWPRFHESTVMTTLESWDAINVQYAQRTSKYIKVHQSTSNLSILLRLLTPWPERNWLLWTWKKNEKETIRTIEERSRANFKKCHCCPAGFQEYLPTCRSACMRSLTAAGQNS